MSLKKLFLHVVRVLSSPLVGRHTSSGSVSENMRKRRGASFSQVIILVLCFLFNQSKAQNYFNKRIDLFGKADLTANIFIDNNQYYVTGGGFNAAQTDISLSVLKFDNNCNQIKETHNFQNNAWFYGGTTHGITKINDSVLCTIGFRSGPTSMKGYLYCS